MAPPGKKRRKRSEPPPKTGKDTSDKEEGIELDGVVIENLPNAQFRVRLTDTDQEVLTYVSGKMRKGWIKILTGDRVKVEFSPYDLTRARITYRFKN